jgi:hypothetical protein
MRRAPIAMLKLAVAVVLASACRPAPHEGATTGADAAGAPVSAADQAAIRAADTAFSTAAGAGDAAGLGAMYLPNASLMPPNAATVQGREAIQKFWGAFVDAYPKAKGPAAAHDEGFSRSSADSRTAPGSLP